MPAIFDFLYREYCRARLAEMRKQLLISPERHEVPEAICDANDAVGASPASHVSGGGTAPIAPVLDYARDMHTMKGKAMGRGLDHFRKEGARLVPPPTGDDPYED